jgi:hypothetical protein
MQMSPNGGGLIVGEDKGYRRILEFHSRDVNGDGWLHYSDRCIAWGACCRRPYWTGFFTVNKLSFHNRISCIREAATSLGRAGGTSVCIEQSK